VKRIAAWIILISSAVLLQAQSSRDQYISGTVLDSSGAAMPHVAVTAINQNTSFTRSTSTNGHGEYLFPSMPVGMYRLLVSARGFKKYEASNIELTIGQNAHFDIPLSVGDDNVVVTVTDSALKVDTTNGQVSHLITGEEASEIELNGRNYVQLLETLPGISTTYSSGFALYNNYGGSIGAVSINGQRPGTNAWFLDGATNVDTGSGGSALVSINPDSIGQMRVMTANYNAEYGGNSGGVINVAVKSGTKQFHGTLYEYFRNDAIQAYAFNAIAKPELRYNSFGGNLSGPAIIPGLFHKDDGKLFFFFGVDFRRQLQGSTNTWTVPSDANRGGDFSSLAPTSWPKDPLTGKVFPGGIVPKSRWNSSSSRLLQNYPHPLPQLANKTGSNFIFNTVAPINMDEYLARIDYNLNSKNQLMFHYYRDNMLTTLNQAAVNTYERSMPGKSISLQWTFSPTSKLVNVAQISYSGDTVDNTRHYAPNPLFVSDDTRTGEGITYPTIFPYAAQINVIPNLYVSGFNTLYSTPVVYRGSIGVYDFRDDLTTVISNHTLKVGIDYYMNHKNQNNVPVVNGSFTFNTTSRPSGPTATTGNSVADALIGNFYSYTEASGTQQGRFRFTQIEPYVQDDWRVTRRLTLNLGLRWAYMQPQYSLWNNTSVFLPEYYDPSQAVQINKSTGAIVAGSGNSYNGLVLPGTGFPESAIPYIQGATSPAVAALFKGLPRGMAHTPWNTWEPRLGFAYDLFGDGKTVLKGGYGIFYERVQGNTFIASVANPPFVQQPLLYYGNVDQPTGGALQSFPGAINASHRLDVSVPRTMNYSGGIQQALGNSTVLYLTYVGSNASRLQYMPDINQLRAGTLTSSANKNVNVNALRPYLGYTNIYEYTTDAIFNYNSLQAQLRKRFTHGGSLNLAYTWSRGLTDANSFNYTPQDSYNVMNDYGPSSYNRGQIFVASYVYPLPFWLQGRNWYQKALGGWQISGVDKIQSGLPINITMSNDVAGTGTAGSQRPDRVLDNLYLHDDRKQWLNANAFTTPASGTFGNLSAYAAQLPLFSNWDLAIQKSYNFEGGFSASLRAELFNVPNHLSYTSVTTNTSSSAFGQINGATDPRTLSLAVKIKF